MASGGRKTRPLSVASPVDKGLLKTLSLPVVRTRNVTGKPTKARCRSRRSLLLTKPLRAGAQAARQLAWPADRQTPGMSCRPNLAGSRGNEAVPRTPASAATGNRRGPPFPSASPSLASASQPVLLLEALGEPKGALFLPREWQPRLRWGAL